MASKLRSFRADDTTWRAALDRARAEHTTLTAVINAALASYAQRGQPPRPESPGEIDAKVATARQARELGQAIAAGRRAQRKQPPAARAASGRHPCCQHCRHGTNISSHADPCSQCT